MKRIIMLCLLILLPIITACQSAEEKKAEQEKQKQLEVAKSIVSGEDYNLKSKKSPF